MIYKETDIVDSLIVNSWFCLGSSIFPQMKPLIFQNRCSFAGSWTKQIPGTTPAHPWTTHLRSPVFTPSFAPTSMRSHGHTVDSRKVRSWASWWPSTAFIASGYPPYICLFLRSTSWAKDLCKVSRSVHAKEGYITLAKSVLSTKGLRMREWMN